ncbi:zinc finger MYM-type protein 5-like [Heracleum sosnowskyi]|uniref:Zinc finger MYM-type protein 5-like n=1 Tax=Heracleum sosnowskyi TaxID=360622 RepID=A0AAD8MRL9_9APIA|nr:zinc finger MYM-type protein 5-like [Heracleum sosnowskyi]
MDKFLIKRPRFPSATNTHVLNLNSAADSNAFIPDTNTPTQKRANIEFNPDSIISDPGARIPIDEYDVNIRDQVRRAYIAKGPFRPVDYTFPKNGDSRTFQANWFGEFDWLEYSIHKDAAFCMWCYLFNPKRADNSGKNAFTTTGFKKWKKALNKFRSKASRSNAPGNCQLTSLKVQKELVRACASETRSLIFADIGNSFFTLMVDESRDISLKEQMAVVLRYVNKHGEVIERLLPTFIYTVLKFFVG